MSPWTLVRWLAATLRSIILPRWLREGRLSYRVAVGLTLLLLLVESLPADHPTRESLHAAYTTGLSTIADRFDATWRPRFQAAAAQGELAAELERLYWLEAEAQVMLEKQAARYLEIENAIASYQPLERSPNLHSSSAKNVESRLAELAAVQEELEHVAQIIRYYAATVEQVQALRLEAEVSRQRLDDYLALLNTGAGNHPSEGLAGDAIKAVTAEFERRRRIILERSQIRVRLDSVPYD